MASEWRYRGRVLTADDVTLIRQLIAENPSASRRRLSEKLCEVWQWKQANGALRAMVCRGLLLMLQQTVPFQIRALREYVVRRGWTLALQVKEVGSGASQRQLREKLLEAARRREIDVVLVWRLDRWGRSVADLLATLQELEPLGVGFVSLTEAVDLTTPAGRAMGRPITAGLHTTQVQMMLPMERWWAGCERASAHWYV